MSMFGQCSNFAMSKEGNHDAFEKPFQRLRNEDREESPEDFGIRQD